MTLSLPFVIYWLSAEAKPERSLSLMDQLLHSNVFNVLLAIAILVWLFRKFKLSGKIADEQRRISGELLKLEAERSRAAALLDDMRKTAADLPTEVEAILREARQSAEVLSAQIIATAEAEAEKIVEAGRRRMALEQRAAQKHLEERLFNEAMDSARDALAHRSTPEVQRRSVEDFIDALPALFQKSAR